MCLILLLTSTLKSAAVTTTAIPSFACISGSLLAVERSREVELGDLSW